LLFDALPKRLKYSVTPASAVSCSHRHGVQLGDSHPAEHLLREVRTRQASTVRDVARVDDERRPVGHCIHQVHRLAERPGDIRVSVLGEADVGVADLQEERLCPGPRRACLSSVARANRPA
jgi:hypothetical protein